MTVYCLTIKTWAEYDRAHHFYGRIHWVGADGYFKDDDAVAEPDADGFCTARHETRESVIAGARRWFAEHRRDGDVLLIGTWGLGGWVNDWPYEVLEGVLTVTEADGKEKA